MFFDIPSTNVIKCELESVSIFDTSIIDEITSEVLESVSDYDKADSLIESVVLEAEEAERYKKANVKSVINKIKEFFVKLIQHVKAFFASLKSKFVTTIDGYIKYIESHKAEIEKAASGPDVNVEIKVYDIDKIKQMWDDITNNGVLVTFKKVRANNYRNYDDDNTNYLELTNLYSFVDKHLGSKDAEDFSEKLKEFIDRNVITKKITVNKNYKELMEDIKDMKNIITETEKLSNTIVKSLNSIMNKLIEVDKKLVDEDKMAFEHKDIIISDTSKCINIVERTSGALIKCAEVNAKSGYSALMAMTNKNRTKTSKLI